MIAVSNRPRPEEWGEYKKEEKTDPKELLTDWNEWKAAHIGRPALDTYLQAINPITAVTQIPQEAYTAMSDMRDRKKKYNTKIKYVSDEPITIEWEEAAANELSKIYADNEKIPTDNYTPMRYRKIAHIIKIAGICAVLRDEITLTQLDDIKKKHQKNGKKELEKENKAREEYEKACKELESAQKDGKQQKDLIGIENRQNEALKTLTKAKDATKSKVWEPMRKEITEKFVLKITGD